MIRIQRGREPGGLSRARDTELKRIRKDRHEHPNEPMKFGDKYKTHAARPLYEAQGHKCCYCEKKLAESKCNDTEHFRPKARARRAHGPPDEGYWWLAWTWDNLLFACRVCNQCCKRDKFPLAEGSTALTPEEQPPGAEQPLLIDPAGEDDPLDLIGYQSIKVRGKSRWIPYARNGDPRAEETIRLLRLDRTELVTTQTEHANSTVRREFREFREWLNPESDLRDISKR